VNGQLYDPALYNRGKDPRYSEPVRMTWKRENSDPTGTRIPTPPDVQPVASRYTDYAIPAPVIWVFVIKFIRRRTLIENSLPHIHISTSIPLLMYLTCKKENRATAIFQDFRAILYVSMNFRCLFPSLWELQSSQFHWSSLIISENIYYINMIK
jgi:hypothetical protein